MHSEPSQHVQRAVLGLLLETHPKSLTIPEVASQIGGEGTERAVRDLLSVGLLEVRASAGALRFERLELP